jgi:hypothetical protein
VYGESPRTLILILCILGLNNYPKVTSVVRMKKVSFIFFNVYRQSDTYIYRERQVDISVKALANII